MKGTSLYNNGNTGAVFLEAADFAKFGHQWQLFRVDEERYMLRSRDSVNGTLAARYWDKEDTPGNTVPYVQKNATDNSMFWKFGSWGDGTFYLSNESNGTDWHLSKKSTGLIMTSNITAPQPDQGWVISAVGVVDNPKFSTIRTPSTTIILSASGSPVTTQLSTTTTTSQSTAAPISTITTTPTPTPTATSAFASTQSPLPSGLSTGARAGIGAAAGVVGVISIVGFILFFLRRRAKKAPPVYYKYEEPPPQELGDGSGFIKYEMYQPPIISELPEATAPQRPEPVLHPIIYTSQH
jgi:hypothetical protein